jgi:hypothetical protein
VVDAVDIRRDGIGVADLLAPALGEARQRRSLLRRKSRRNDVRDLLVGRGQLEHLAVDRPRTACAAVARCGLAASDRVAGPTDLTAISGQRP